jgi:hypothetical protein
MLTKQSTSTPTFRSKIGAAVTLTLCLNVIWASPALANKTETVPIRVSDGAAGANPGASAGEGTGGCVGGTIAISGDTITATCPYSYTVVFLPGHYQADGTGSAVALRAG